MEISAYCCSSLSVGGIEEMQMAQGNCGGLVQKGPCPASAGYGVERYCRSTQRRVLGDLEGYWQVSGYKSPRRKSYRPGVPVPAALPDLVACVWLSQVPSKSPDHHIPCPPSARGNRDGACYSMHARCGNHRLEKRSPITAAKGTRQVGVSGICRRCS